MPLKTFETLCSTCHGRPVVRVSQDSGVAAFWAPARLLAHHRCDLKVAEHLVTDIELLS
jgi:hypothetical protein